MVEKKTSLAESWQEHTTRTSQCGYFSHINRQNTATTTIAFRLKNKIQSKNANFATRHDKICRFCDIFL